MSASTFDNAKKGGFVVKPKGHEDYLMYLSMMAGVRALGEQPVDWSSVESIRNRVLDYFEVMKENNCRPTVSSLAMSFGISRQMLNDLKTGRKGKTGKYAGMTDECRAELAKAYEMLEVLFESYVMHDDINPMLAVMIGSNNYGYRNASSIEVNTPAIDMDGEPTAEAIRLKYGEATKSLPSETKEDKE